MASILLIHGPNLNLLGTREPEVYGNIDLSTLNQELEQTAKDLGHKITSFQSNAEHEIIDIIQEALGKMDFIIINPAAYTHTSIAIRDALLAVQIPFIEVHLSNPMARESFRHASHISDIATGIISGFGALGYQLALLAANQYLT